MKYLSFAPPRTDRSGVERRKRVRQGRFEARSALPTSAACVVANGVRETLGSLLGSPVAVRLFEPSIPAPQAWAAIVCDALIYRVRGTVADAAIILRNSDAIALAGSLFGEPQEARHRRELSPVERDVVDRAADAIAANLGAVCGVREGRRTERVAAIAGFVTYFELSLHAPIDARIGVALSRDPSPEPHGAIEIGHLGKVRLTVRASLDLGNVEAAVVAALACGTTIPLPPENFARCALALNDRRLATGSCGVRSGRYALAIQGLRETA
jgi:hypothetical protein